MSAANLRVVAIELEQAAFALLNDLLSDRIDADAVEIDYSGAAWARFHLKLTGDDYHSTINSDLMRSLVEYQNTLYRIAAYVKNGKLNAGAIDEKSRDRLRLNIKVGDGSSEYIADLIKALTELAGKVTDGMGPKTKAVMVLSIGLMLVGVLTLPELIEHHYRAIDDEHRAAQHQEDIAVIRDLEQHQSDALKAALDNQKILNEAISQNPALAEVRKQVHNATSEIMKQSSDADSVQFHDFKISGQAARTLTGTKRRSGEDATLQGVFIVEAADFANPDGFVWKVKRITDGVVIQATMFDAAASEQALVLLSCKIELPPNSAAFRKRWRFVPLP